MGLVGCHDTCVTTWSLRKGAGRHIRVDHARWMQISDSGLRAAIDVDRDTGRETQAGRQAGRQADRQTDGQTDGITGMSAGTTRTSCRCTGVRGPG